MKRAFLAIFCGAALFASSIAYAADTASDKEMADRYSEAAQSGDSDAQFYLAALYSAGVGRSRSDAEAFRWFSRAADQGQSQPALAASKSPPATTTSSAADSGNSQGPRISGDKKNDIDALLDRVPSGLRKRFGF